MILYYIKKIDGKNQIVWNTGRLRGLTEAKERIGDLTKEADKLLKKKKKIKILEIGCGYGKALLELKKIFGDKIEIHGTNLEQRWKKDLVRKFGISNKIFSKKEINKNLPKIHILDIGHKTHFKSNSFDLIFSQACFQYVNDKAKALEEINRILTKKGKAIIELDELKLKHPPEYQNLFEIWNGNKKINSIIYIKKYKNIVAKKVGRGKDCSGKIARRNWHVLIMKKANNFKLNLKLIVSFDLNKINKHWWGYKSIYVLK